MEFLLNWILRGIFLSLGIGAAIAIVRWLQAARGVRERWIVRLGAGMVGLALLYGAAHIRLLAQRGSIEEGRGAYAIFGDPRRTEAIRGEVRGWLLDCTGEDDRALARYRLQEDRIERTFPLGEAGANFIGGGKDADERDYTIENLFAQHLRTPANLLERGELHPRGEDLPLTLCSATTAEAYRQLSRSGRPGAVIVQEVSTGALLAYAATGGAQDVPLGIKHYSPPGSVFKLALAALWWEHQMPDDIVIPCPAEIRVSANAKISNAGGVDRGEVIGPLGMLIPSCNTAAVWMALHLRERIGSEAFVEGYRRMGFLPYSQAVPTDSARRFWRTSSPAWERRMTPPPSRIRISGETGTAEWAQLSIGQGPLDVTVIAISRFLQAIANDGVMLPPTFERDQLSRRARGERIMSPEVAQRLQEAMLEIVQQGTGRAAGAALRERGWRVGGKTGTAQIAGRADNGWFAGILFSPQGEPRYTIVTFLEGGGPGGGMPASIAGTVAQQLAEAAPEIEGRR